MSNIELNLRMQDGKVKNFIQSFVPVSKTIEYIELESKLFDEHKGKVPQTILDLARFEFVASLFDAEEVTQESILSGLDTTDAHVIMDIINQRVMGIKPEEIAEKKSRKKT